MGEWSPDTELDGYEQLIFPLPGEPTYALEPENSLVATLVRRDGPRSRSALLYVLGWNDYFFQTHLADEIEGKLRQLLRNGGTNSKRSKASAASADDDSPPADD